MRFVVDTEVVTTVTKHALIALIPYQPLIFTGLFFVGMALFCYLTVRSLHVRLAHMIDEEGIMLVQYLNEHLTQVINSKVAEAMRARSTSNLRQNRRKEMANDA